MCRSSYVARYGTTSNGLSNHRPMSCESNPPSHLLSSLGNARHGNNQGTGGDVGGGLLGGLRLGTGTGSTGTRRGEATGRVGRGSPTGKCAEGIRGEHGDAVG